MANRYLRASGNWDGAVWAATSSGAAGSASTPTSSDDVYIDSSFTLNANADIDVTSFRVSYSFTGTINFGSGSHSLGVVQFTGGNINLQSSIITVSGMTASMTGGTTGSINPGSSTVIIEGTISTPLVYGVANRNINLNTVIVNRSIGALSHTNINTLILAGTTSNNIYVSNNSTFNVRKIIYKGSSANIGTTPSGGNATINFPGSNQIIYIDKPTISGVSATGSGTYYVDNISPSRPVSGWTYSTPSLISSLSDNFNAPAIDTNKWTVTGGTLTQSGGTLNFSGTGFATATIISKNQYLAEGSGIKFKASVGTGSLTAYLAIASQQYGISATTNIPNIYAFISPTQVRLHLQADTSFTSLNYTNSYSYYQIRESSGTIYLDGSNDGIAYTNITSVDASDYGLDTTQLIARPNFAFYRDSSGTISIDDFNVELEPTAQFTQNTTSGNTPLTVNFTDQSNFSPTSWSWDFGDSTTSTSQNPSKTYSAPGTYTVSLTSSKTGTSRSVTKTGLITVSPNVYTRSISGTLKISGSVSRTLTANRSISGTLKLGGGVDNRLIRDAEAIQGKRFLYKVYDEDGTYIETWGKEVIDELNYTHEINMVGSTITVQLARNSDSISTSTEPLLTEDGEPLLTEDNQPIEAVTVTRNNIGAGTSVDYNNRVDIWAYYGSTEPLYTESMEEILTEDGEPILVDLGAPNGRKIFSGFISEINSRYGNTDTTIVQLTSYGWDLDQYILTTNDNKTTRTFNSTDPSVIIKTSLDRFNAVADDSHIVYESGSIPNTSTSVSYTFKVNTYKEVMDKTLELMPSDWFYRVDLGTGLVTYNERRQQPHHRFLLGKHIKALDLKGSTMDTVNHVLFTGGGEPALFIEEKENPANRTRRRLEVMSDNRVTLSASAKTIAEGKVEDNNKIQYRTTIEVLSDVYDIESISVGETVGFRNFGNYIDSLTMQVVGLSYNPDFVQLQLETKPPTINKRLEDIRRNLQVTENQNVPDAPS